MRNRLPALTPVLLSALASTACSDLALIEANQCGNHVLDDNEHCDGEANCRPAGGEGQCRYGCDPTLVATACPAGCDPLSNCPGCCPSGFGCGVDHVCRQADGEYSVVVSASAAPTLGLALGDLDHDGRTDVVRLSTDTTSVHFYGDGLAPATTTILWGATALPLPGNLTDDKLPDLTQRVFMGGEFGGGLAVFRSQQDRSLLGTAYASISLKDINHARFAAVDVLPPVLPKELLAFRDTNIEGIRPGEADKQTLVANWPRDVENLVGIAVGNFNEELSSSPCEEIAFAYRGAHEVWVLQPCAESYPGAWPSAPLDEGDIPTVSLPPGFVIHDIPGASTSAAIGGAQALFAVHANYGDGTPPDPDLDTHLDLAIVAAGPTGPTVLLAYGGGNGHFHSTLPLPALVADYDDEAAVMDLTVVGECRDEHGELLDLGLPLALADFNGDDQLDVVSKNLVLMSAGSAYAIRGCDNQWSGVAVADFNGNGALDLVAARQDGPGLDFLDGTGGGVFSHSVLPTKQPVAHLAAGDFDGDLLADVVFAQRARAAPADGSVDDELFVSFGRPAGSPELPEKLGELNPVDQILPGPIRVSDSADEILVLSKVVTASATVLRAAIVIGNGDRALHAPFILRQMVQGAPVTEPVWVTRGTFLTDKQAMAVMTQDDEFHDRNYRVWLVRPLDTDQADLFAAVAAESARSEEPTGLQCGGCIAAAVDLQNDGIDELVTFDSTALSVYEVVDGGAGFGLSASYPTEIAFGSEESSREDVRVRPIVTDIDRDGRPDVALMAQTDVIILWNDEADQLARRWAEEDATAVTRLRNPSGDDMAGFTLLQVDADPELELALLDSAGVKLLQLVGARQFEPLQQVEPLGDWSDDGKPVPGGDVIAAGDLDGDGVDDLVIGDFGTYTVLRGKPVLP